MQYLDNLKRAELHAHSHYSNIRMLDSTNKIEKLIDEAIKLKLRGLAITDHESLSGHIKAIKHVKSIKEKNKEDKDIQDFKLILGNEIYLCRNGLNNENYVKGEDKYFHFILLAKDEKGHRQLRELSSRAWTRSYYQFIERVPTYYSDIEDIIGANPGHIIASTACLGGFLGSKILQMGADSCHAEQYMDEIKDFIGWGKHIFGDDFYLEIQPSNSKEQVYANKYIVEYAKHFDVKVIATTDTHYLKEEDREVHKAYLNAGEGDREVDDFYATTYLMTPAQMWTFFEKRIGFELFENILNNTVEICDKCEDYDLYHNPIVPKIKPDSSAIKVATPVDVQKFAEFAKENNYEFMYKYATSEDTQDRFLFARIVDGLMEKFNHEELKPYHFERIDIELKELWEISDKMGERLSAYLITVSKIIEIIWNEGDSLVGPSRGSALGFFINYLLDITQISPLDKDFELPHWRSEMIIGLLSIAI